MQKLKTEFQSEIHLQEHDLYALKDKIRGEIRHSHD